MPWTIDNSYHQRGMGMGRHVFEVLDLVGVEDCRVVGQVGEGVLCHDADEQIVIQVDCLGACVHGAAVRVPLDMARGACFCSALRGRVFHVSRGPAVGRPWRGMCLGRRRRQLLVLVHWRRQRIMMKMKMKMKMLMISMLSWLYYWQWIVAPHQDRGQIFTTNDAPKATDSRMGVM